MRSETEGRRILAFPAAQFGVTFKDDRTQAVNELLKREP